MRQSIETSLTPGAGHMSHPGAHRLDELSAGYSSAGCSPAVPASAFPAASEFGNRAARKSTIFQRTATVPLCCCLSLGVHAIVLLAVAELFVPVQHYPDLRATGLREALLHHKLPPICRNVAAAPTFSQRFVGEKSYRRPDRQRWVGGNGDRHPST